MPTVLYNVNIIKMKNNYLILALLLVLFATKNKQNDSLKKLLASVSMEDALSLLKLLGVNEKLLDSVSSILPELSGEHTDIISLLKKMLPLILSLATAQKSSTDSQAEPTCDDENTPTADFIPDEIKKDLADYFF